MSTEKKRILVSVTDKSLLVDLKPLLDLGFEFISTGGTAEKLRELGFPVTDVAKVTGFPEGMNGRIKTLHPKIFGGLLADRMNPSHMEFLAEHHLDLFEVVVVNLYNFAGNPSIDQIDVGGPSMIRAAGKNYKSVVPVCHPVDYGMIVVNYEQNGGVAEDIRLLLASKVFRLTAKYDAAIADWYEAQLIGAK